MVKLLLYLSLRDRNHLVYVAFAASMAAGQLSLNGFGNQFLWPHWPNWGSAVFSSGFLATRRHTPRLDRLILLLTACRAAPTRRCTRPSAMGAAAGT